MGWPTRTAKELFCICGSGAWRRDQFKFLPGKNGTCLIELLLELCFCVGGSGAAQWCKIIEDRELLESFIWWVQRRKGVGEASLCPVRLLGTGWFTYNRPWKRRGRQGQGLLPSCWRFWGEAAPTSRDDLCYRATLPGVPPFWGQPGKVKVKLLSRVRLFGTPWTVAYQALLSVGFSRQ